MSNFNLTVKSFDLHIQLDSRVFISDAQSQTTTLIFQHINKTKHVNIGEKTFEKRVIRMK